MISGQLQLAFVSTISSTPHLKSGRLRALAVTGLKRTPAVPGVPTVAESGLPGFEVVGYFGMFAPPATPREIVTRLNAEINKALALPDVAQQLAVEGATPMPTTPQAFGDLIKREIPRWAEVVKVGNVKPE